jgi:hypothetical protein
MTDTAANFYVYMLFRLNGMPCYVGKGKGDRWKRHQGRKKNSNRHLGSIIDQARAADKELPKVKVAEGLTEETAFNIERLLIGCIGRGDAGPLVNLTDGGDGPSGYKPSAELIERQAAGRRGKVRTPEQRARTSAALKGRPKSAAHAASAGAAQRGGKKSSGWWSTEEGRAKQKQNNRGNTGKSHSKEAKSAIRAARARQPKIISSATLFQAGQPSWNKGISVSLSPATQFKPGHEMSDQARANLSNSVKESWARRKAFRQSSIYEGEKS